MFRSNALRVTCLVGGLLLVGSCGGDDSTSTSAAVIATSTTITAETTSTISPAPSTSSPSPPTTTVPGETTTTTPAPDVVIEGDSESEIVVTGPDLFVFSIGEQLSITVLSSVQDEIHVHGYDLFYEMVPGEITTISFLGDVPGIFEVELESSHTQLFSIEVS